MRAVPAARDWGGIGFSPRSVGEWYASERDDALQAGRLRVLFTLDPRDELVAHPRATWFTQCARDDEEESRIANQVASPEPPGLLCQSIEPFESGRAHPAWRATQIARDEVQAGSDRDGDG